MRTRNAVNAGRTLTLNGIGLVLECSSKSSPAIRVKFKWEAVRKLARTRGQFILKTKASLVIVPRRAFDSRSSEDQFFDFCHSNIGSAR